MPKSYQFSMDQIAELKSAKQKNKNKRVDKRLEALLLRAGEMSRKAVSEKTGFSRQHITELTAQYHNEGLQAIIGNHYKGNRRNMSYEEEEKLLAVFADAAGKGQIIEVSAIQQAYEKQIGRSVEKSHGHIYQVLRRHNFRKVMPRSQHPEKAGGEAIEASKKLTFG